MNDQQLESFLRENRPQTEKDPTFILETRRRMAEVEGIKAEVIDIATIKPLDEEAILKSAKKTGAVVVAEEHNMAGGLGEAVAGLLARTVPTPVEFVNGQDLFGQSGTPSALLAAYGLDAQHIAEAAKKVIARK